MQRSPQEQQLRHIMENLKPFPDILHSQSFIPVKDVLGGFLVELVCFGFHYTEKFLDFVMFSIYSVRSPKHIVPFFYFIHGPKQFPFQN